MGYLADYVYYSSGNECPEDYLYWGGLSLLGHILGNKVWIKHGDYFRFHPNLYVCVVGDAGSGKNTALGVNIEIMIEHFADMMLSASIQSREDVADLMSSDDCIKTWKTEAGKIHEYRPFYILNNELASFLSVDKMKMVEFLTEVYDGKRFSTGFKNQRREDPTRKQWFHNPHLSLLAGAVPTWFMSNLKMDLFSGGLGRRLIIVYSERTKVIPDPRKPKDADLALERAVNHLKHAASFCGEIVRTPDALKWWEQWYAKFRNQKPDDPILSQFHQTKHMQLLKVALCLRMAEPPLDGTLSADYLIAAEALLNQLEPSVMKLTCGVGRNELAGIASTMLETIRANGGAISEKRLQAMFFRHLMPKDFMEVVTHLQKTEQIVWTNVVDNGVDRRFLFTPDRYEEIQRITKK